MTSHAKIETNRRNALRSTGPRTSAGKARSARNALKHGLAVPVERDCLFVDRLEALTAELGRTIPKSPDQIRLVALAHLEVERVQEQWTKVIEDGMNAIGGGAQIANGADLPLQRLPSLTRYERRALSHLRKMLHKLEEP